MRSTCSEQWWSECSRYNKGSSNEQEKNSANHSGGHCACACAHDDNSAYNLRYAGLVLAHKHFTITEVIWQHANCQIELSLCMWYNLSTMNSGKISDAILKRSIVNLIHHGRPVCIDGADISDSFIACIQSGIDKDYGAEMAAVKAANNIAAAGGKVAGFLTSYMLPARSDYREIKLKSLTRRMLAACARLGGAATDAADKASGSAGRSAEIIGGDTYVSEGVNEPVVTVSCYGRRDCEAVDVSKCEPGMDIILTKWIGIGEAVRRMNNPEDCKRMQQRFPAGYLSSADDYSKWLSVRDEADICIDILCDNAYDGRLCMHDISGSGLEGALYTMSEECGHGYDADLAKVPVRQEFIEIAELLDYNIYSADATGSLMIVTDMTDALMKRFEEKGIQATVIGKITACNDKMLRRHDL